MEIRVSRDIRTYKTKDIGNFSFKEIAWLVLGIGLGILVYLTTKSFEWCIPPIAICLVFGFLKPFKMPMTKFIKIIGKDILSPRVYYWQSDFKVSEEDAEDDELDAIQASKELEDMPVAYTKEEKALLFK